MAIIKLKQPSLWTKDSGLIALGDLLALDRFEDNFDGVLLDAVNFGTSLAGTGSMNECGTLKGETPFNSAAAIWHYRSALITNQADVWSVKFNLWAGSFYYPFCIAQDSGGEPTVDTASRRIHVQVMPSGKFRIEYLDSSVVWRTWNETSGVWTTSILDIPTAINYDHEYEIKLIKTSTTWGIQIIDLNTSTIIVDTTISPVTWASMYDTATPYYMLSGDIFTTVSVMSMNSTGFRTNYPLSPLVASMGQVDVYAAFEQFPITQAGDVVWEYNKDGGGWTQPGSGTPAEVDAALSGFYIRTIDFRATLASDTLGDAAAYFDINGGVLAGPVRLPRYGVRQ